MQSATGVSEYPDRTPKGTLSTTLTGRGRIPSKPMKHHILLAALSGWLALATAPGTTAQPAMDAGNRVAQSSGVVEGRVFNTVTGEYVRNAAVRLQGTNRVVYSGEGGRFRFVNVPAGEATLIVEYAGYPAVTSMLSVPPGQTATHDFELAHAGGQAVRLGEFVVSAEREGNAKAIMQQRRNMNITTS